MAKLKPSRSDAKQLLVPECSVSGPLALVLLVSRVVGVAPLRFRRSGGAWRVKMSMAACIYTFFIATTINLGALICLLLDNSTRNLSPVRRFTRLWDFLLVVAIASVVAYGAPRRLKETISCLARIGKINASTLKKPSRKTVLSATFIICFIILVVLFTLDYKVFVSGSAFKYSITTPTYFYFTYFYAYLMLVLFETQYVLIAFEVANAFQDLGNLFEDTSRLINVYYTSHDDVIASMPLKVVPTKSVNQIVDSMAQIKSTPVFSVTPTLESVSETIRRLALMYAEVCSVVRQLDSCHGLVVVMLLLSFLLHLVVSVYNFIMSKPWFHAWYIFRVMWFLLHMTCTIWIAEPSHKTQQEEERICTLVSRMIINSPDGMLFTELEKFSRYLLVNKAVYCPLGVCTLSRSLIASLFGSVVTYLVIIVQFQLSEK